jgi:hypothetical protein
MGDQVKDGLDRLSQNIERLVSFWDGEVEVKVANEKRMTNLEARVGLLMWVLAIVSVGTIGAIITALAAILSKGHP